MLYWKKKWFSLWLLKKLLASWLDWLIHRPNITVFNNTWYFHKSLYRIMHYSHGHLWFFVPFVWSLLHWIKSFSLASWQMSKWFLIAVWFTGWNFINFPVTFKKKCSSISYLTHCILLELYFLNSKLFYFTPSKVCSISLLNCNSKICSNIIEVNKE